jgi:hypothetical protein
LWNDHPRKRRGDRTQLPIHPGWVVAWRLIALFEPSAFGADAKKTLCR